jgi:hypothetical protein
VSLLANEIWRACADLGLSVEIGYTMTLTGGKRLETIARIADLGAHNGMLVFSSYDAVRNMKDALRDAGYGFTVLDEPNSREIYDVETFRQIFRDWGWAGELGRKPKWMY